MSEPMDEVAVERAIKGDQSITLNRAEMAEAVARLEAKHLSVHQIADVLGANSRSVARWRAGETAPITRPGVTVDSTKEKIANALRSEHPPIQRAAKKANDALASLDSLLADWDAKALARERIAELEAQLAEAKAALRPKTGKRTGKPSAPGEHKQARAWARQQGIAVPDIGRVPSDVLDAWRQATGNAA